MGYWGKASGGSWCARRKRIWGEKGSGFSLGSGGSWGTGERGLGVLGFGGYWGLGGKRGLRVIGVPGGSLGHQGDLSGSGGSQGFGSSWGTRAFLGCQEFCWTRWGEGSGGVWGLRVLWGLGVLGAHLGVPAALTSTPVVAPPDENGSLCDLPALENGEGPIPGGLGATWGLPGATWAPGEGSWTPV